MKSGKGHQEEEEEVDEEFCARKDAMPSTNNAKEQRRRSKINERFQLLRELIPNSNQERDTASFYWR
ncbi:transcription factor BIM2 [Olea europaea subsp. europaea]|uniref:Transcription factor BIM2 n=1 Tax=Olea europaea subsp. europaea TaxID=158383 RepID=A0A8S0PX80_OLEEU|nr:transcription factor BIM2 [Olea europaea subsp. europaea]